MMKSNYLPFLSRFKLSIIILLFTLNSVYSQSDWKVTYKKINLDNTESESVLLFDNNQSFFYTKSEKAKTKPYRDSDGDLVSPSNTIDSIANKKVFVYYNREMDKFFTNTVNNNKETLILLDSNTQNWLVTDEHKSIGKYKTTKAIKTINSKEYTAWFTPEISYPYGPIALNGLQGLILELYDENKSAYFIFEKIEQNTDEKIEKLLKGYNFSTAVSYQEYLERIKK